MDIFSEKQLTSKLWQPCENLAPFPLVLLLANSTNKLIKTVGPIQYKFQPVVLTNGCKTITGRI